MMKVCCAVSYDGTNYAGWQFQPQQQTVQGTIEESLSRLLKTKIRIHGAGRTDAGVHARCQYFTFELPDFFPRAQLITAVNSMLPNDIVVFSQREVSTAFDVRRDARMRWYRYRFYYASVPDPFERLYSLWIRPPFDWTAVRQAVTLFRGENDFSAFRSSRCTANRVLLTIEEAELREEGTHFYFDIKARSFLHHMVRICAGTLWEIGKGRLEPQQIPGILASKKRGLAGKTLDPKGLFLMEVRYNNGILTEAIPNRG